MLLLSIALAAPDLGATFRDQPPHTAVYHKASTGQPVLEVTVNDPRRGTLRAFSPDGVFVVSVDPTHMRVRLHDGTCASVDAASVFAAADASVPGYTPEGPASSGLVYRVDGSMQVDMSTAFRRAKDPPLLSWHDDLRLPSVTTKEEGKGWVASGPGTSWTLETKTGRLRRMEVGDDALVLEEVRLDEDAPLPRPEAICATSTDPTLHHQLTSQLRTYAFLDPLQHLESTWPTLGAVDRAKAIQAQVDAWQPGYREQATERIGRLDGVGALADLARQAPPAPSDEAERSGWVAKSSADICLYLATEMARAELQGMMEAWAGGWTPSDPFVDELLFRSQVEAFHRAIATTCEPVVKEKLLARQ